VDTVDTVSAMTLPAFCAVLFGGVRGDPSFTCGDLLLGRRGFLFVGTWPSLRSSILDPGLVTTVGVSRNRKIDIEIVGWLPQLNSRTLDILFVRMIDNCNKYLLNQIMRASTPKIMKFYTCVSTRFMYRALSHSQSV